MFFYGLTPGKNLVVFSYPPTQNFLILYEQWCIVTKQEVMSTSLESLPLDLTAEIATPLRMGVFIP
jgi:hypothetical protein